MTRTCFDCSTPLGPRCKSGLCRPCLGRRNFGTPEAKARAKAGLQRHLADPANRAAHAARSQEHLRAWRATPAGAAVVRDRALANLERTHTPEAEARRIHSIRAAAWAGIPESRWDEAADLSKTFGSAEARRMILEDEAKQRRQRIAAMTPFERQMERVKNGAQLVTKPDTRRSAHDFTLGGVATGML